MKKKPVVQIHENESDQEKVERRPWLLQWIREDVYGFMLRIRNLSTSQDS